MRAPDFGAATWSAITGEAVTLFGTEERRLFRRASDPLVLMRAFAEGGRGLGRSSERDQTVLTCLVACVSLLSGRSCCQLQLTQKPPSLGSIVANSISRVGVGGGGEGVNEGRKGESHMTGKPFYGWAKVPVQCLTSWAGSFPVMAGLSRKRPWVSIKLPPLLVT
ncbi:hypothetical protein AGOR_G00201620 [Albula goreensis]|uniref:Uncharacterized protein n=1 Tax=Albula goreensis TaxID=1534307 RepID=A0A8T3CX45_9TELE|nr:hypothetical protein AGOR_G00201620 [Albula goreensis]